MRWQQTWIEKWSRRKKIKEDRARENRAFYCYFFCESDHAGNSRCSCGQKHIGPIKLADSSTFSDLRCSPTKWNQGNFVGSHSVTRYSSILVKASISSAEISKSYILELSMIRCLLTLFGSGISPRCKDLIAPNPEISFFLPGIVTCLHWFQVYIALLTILWGFVQVVFHIFGQFCLILVPWVSNPSSKVRMPLHEHHFLGKTCKALL